MQGKVMRRTTLLLAGLAFMLAFFLAAAPLQASAMSLTHMPAKSLTPAHPATCGQDTWLSENSNSSLDVQVWENGCNFEDYALAYLLQNPAATVYVDIGSDNNAHFAQNTGVISPGQHVYSGTIQGGSGEYACAANEDSGASVCTFL